MPDTPDISPETDLHISREIAASPETVWRCFTDPDLFARWFTPPSVGVKDVHYGFYPGGPANLTMIMPDGSEMPLRGCVLEAQPARKLVTSDAVTAGFRPAAKPFMTAIYDLHGTDAGTFLTATVLHPSAAERQTHENMGFHEGWGTTFGQLAALASTLKGD